MGLLATILSPFQALFSTLPVWQVVCFAFTTFVTLAIVLNILHQLVFRDPNEPPLVFHLVPFIGSTIVYGIDPFKFFFSSREKYGDVFTFIPVRGRDANCQQSSS